MNSSGASQSSFSLGTEYSSGGRASTVVPRHRASHLARNPSTVSRQVLISELAGRSNIILKAQELGFDVTKDTPELSEMLTRVKALEHVEAAINDVAAAVDKALAAEHGGGSAEG